MNRYFDGSISQMIERGRRLLGRITSANPPWELRPLAAVCNQKIEEIITEFEILADDPDLLQPENQNVRIRMFRRAIRRLDMLENRAVAAIYRHKKDDIYLTRLLDQICQEIHYPLTQPFISGQSQSYFYIDCELDLLCVPLSESDFLLHLPDLYHELAHPLLSGKHHPAAELFLEAANHTLGDILSYFEQALDRETRGLSPIRLADQLCAWMKNWSPWIVELYCDLFAVFTLGPAYGWSHLHLVTKHGGNPFLIDSTGNATHPADDARMQAILHGLRLGGFDKQADEIENQWALLIDVIGTEPDSDYKRCYPIEIIENITLDVHQAVQNLGCRIVTPQVNDPIYSLLNTAWDEFWKDPNGYVNWEKQAVLCLQQIEITT